MKRSRFRLIGTVAALSVAGLALSACSGGDSGGDTGGSSTSSGPVEVWSWIPNISTLVDEWNEQNPDAPVELSEQAAGDDATFAKLVAATNSGTAPCLAQTDIKWVTSLVSQGVLQDVTDAAEQYQDDYVPGGWSSVTLADKTYGLPIGSGPMVLYYNEAKLTEYGIDVPTTWEEYAEAAKEIAAEHPGEYLAGLSADDTEKIQSYVQQAGGQWWSIDGDQWRVDVTGDASQKVADLWQGMIDAEAVNTTKRWDPAFYNDIASGKQLSVIGAAWEAPLIQSNAEAVSGDWSVAPMPSWGDSTATANNGGSQFMVLDGCENVEGALDFAHWLTTNTDGLLDLGLFPAVKADELPTPEDLSTFYGDTDVYSLLQDSANNLETPWTFAPTYSALAPKISDLLNDSVTGETTLSDALDSIQDMSLSSMEEEGINASPAN